jgi:hypothetical protein
MTHYEYASEMYTKAQTTVHKQWYYMWITKWILNLTLTFGTCFCMYALTDEAINTELYAPYRGGPTKAWVFFFMYALFVTTVMVIGPLFLRLHSNREIENKYRIAVDSLDHWSKELEKVTL